MTPKPSQPASPGQAPGEAGILKASTGVRGLDEILKGGLPVGRTTMLGGGPGTGKTVLAMELLYRWALADEPGVFVSFEERAEDLRANAAAMGLDVAALEADGKLAIVHADVPHGAVRSGEFDIKGLLAIIEGQARSLGARRIALDAIDVLMRIFGDPQQEREEMYVLHDWLRDRGMTVIFTVKADPSGRQVYPFLDFMADCVLFLDQRTEGQVRTRRLNVIKYRGSDFLSNEHPYILSPRGVVLMPVSCMSLEHEPPGGFVSSGHPELDTVLRGGYLRGTCVLLAGPSGSGKTTVACTFARAVCCNGEKLLYVGFEESEGALVSGMLSVGVDLRPALEEGALKVLTALPESVGIEQHLLRIYDAIDDFGPNHLVVDAMSACGRMGSEEAAFDFLVRLLTRCKERGVTSVFTNQLTEAERVAELSGLGISSLVDTLVLLAYESRGRQLTRSLLVVKSRGVDHSLSHHRFRITSRGLELDLSGEGADNRGAEA